MEKKRLLMSRLTSKGDVCIVRFPGGVGRIVAYGNMAHLSGYSIKEKRTS